MAWVCQVCGKKPVAGRDRSHSMRQSHRSIRPNLQSYKNGKICTRCLRTLKRKTNANTV
ncbi:50S ribosomal protein L28 [Candidatus Berkelbacteria bacterium]|nr:50S ribosomal protein L28 [Candidatus Berkelbacteria bacterium]